MYLLKSYALSLVGQPYRWGGDDTIDGFDCSGVVQEILASAGMDPPGDQTSQGLLDWFADKGRAIHDVFDLGSLAFFGESITKIIHVGFCLDAYRMIEAGGGGSKTKTREDAARQNAYVRIRLISRRSDLQAVMKPRYSPIGCPF